MNYKLSELCEYVKGKVNVEALNSANYVSTENMLPNKEGIVQATTLPSLGQTQIFKSGDVLVSNIRPYFRKIWYAQFDGGCSNDVLVFRAKEGVNDRFLYYVLANDSFFDYSMATSKGTKMPRGDKSSLMKYEIRDVAYKNQDKIAEILEVLDQKIQVNKQINDNLSKLSQMLYLQLSDSVSGNNEQPLSEIIDIRDGTHDSPKSQTFGYPLITSKHLLPFGVDTLSANFISQSDYDKINERSKVNTYDILFSMIGTVGLVSLVIEENVDFAIKNVGLFKTSEHPDLVPYIFEYLKSYKTSVKIDSCLAGSTQKYISLGELRKLPIVIPTPEQLKNYNSIAKPIIKQIASLTAENKALAQLRDSLLPKLMSGEIDVSNINF